MLSLLLSLACVEKPDGPPPPPSKPNRMDTAWSPDEVVADGRDQPPKFESLKLTGAADSDTPARVDVVVKDPEGEMVRTTITWFVNGNRVSGVESAVLADTFFVSGQRIQARVVATDGVNQVTRMTKERTVGNQPPVIDMSRVSLSSFEGVQVRASDPDGDSLSYRIEDAPPGMTIDREGVLHWSGAVEVAGSWRPKVIVSDSQGDEATWEFGVDITAGAEDREVSRSELAEEEG